MNRKEKNKKEIKLRLSEEELAHLNHHVARTGLSREQYLRVLVTDRIPAVLPPADYGVIVRQLNRLEQEIRAAAANLQGEADRFRLMSAVQTVHSTALMMQNALLPQAAAPFIPLQSEVMRSA